MKRIPSFVCASLSHSARQPHLRKAIFAFNLAPTSTLPTIAILDDPSPVSTTSKQE